MLGSNPVRSRSEYDKDHLRVQEVFATIQGEGPYAGTPAIFLRLAGCNLRCTFCDTDFESGFNNRVKHIEAARMIYDAMGENMIRLVVITGGEPLLQHLGPLVRDLSNSGVVSHVQVETAGTVWDESITQHVSSRFLSLVCSPKTGSVHPMIDLYCKHWKYIVKDREAHDHGFPIARTQYSNGPISGRPIPMFKPRGKGNTIYLQPCDEGAPETQRNVQAAIDRCMRYGHNLCLQQHKLIGLP